MVFCKKVSAAICHFAIFLGLSVACVEKDIDPSDPAASFARAREPYDDEMFEVAIQKLSEFKSRFPYSKHAPDAELMIADSQFQLNRFAEAASSYEQFVKLHPRHEKADFAQYRVGESYWSDAPDDIDREQEYTLKAIAEWEKLESAFPNSDQTKKAKELLNTGRRRVAEHSDFIAKFYCKQEIYHACAYRYLELAEQYPQFKDLLKKSYTKASEAFDYLAEGKSKEPESDKNLYYKTYSSSELKQKAKELRDKAASISL